MVSVAQTVTLLICIRDVPGSEIDEALTFLTDDFVIFLSYLKQIPTLIRPRTLSSTCILFH
jgi:hypothetical protein